MTEVATNLFGLERAALEQRLEALGEPRYRGRQLYGWLYEKRVRGFAEMTDLGHGLRARLEAEHRIDWPELARRERASDETVKYLFRLRDGVTVETVLIPEPGRRTICISTQAGCPLKCTFCLTGIAGFRRNLGSGEILGQVAAVMEESAGAEPDPPRPFNIVVMGMGEPLLNCDATLPALRILMDAKAFAIPPRRLTLSTVGILPGLARLAAEPVRPNLAISLHAPDPGLRRALMPVEERHPIEAVLEAVRRYRVPRGGRVTFEYVLLRGVNDSPAHARHLARLLATTRGKVNLIPLNPAPEVPFAAPSAAALDSFCRVLTDAEMTVSVRRPRGSEILAACGQLHLTQDRPAREPRGMRPARNPS
jgi:23S rRNA (adenine2503-C2)-methyltransferase